MNEKQKAREEVYKDVEIYIANDWKLKEETPEFFLLTRNNGSTTAHILIFLFFGCWTIGLANVIYYFVKRETNKILK